MLTEYTIIVSVVDPNPINIKINDKNYVVVKRTSSIGKPEDYEFKEIELDGQTIPALYSEASKLTLLALKNEEGNIKLFIYNETNKSYKEYTEITFEKKKIKPRVEPEKLDNLSFFCEWYKAQGFKITIRDLKPSVGAGFIVALSGDILTMPGLPKVPAANNMNVINGKTVGLF